MKKLKIISATIAKELNSLGDKPDNFQKYMDLELANAASKSEAEIYLWENAEKSLKEYTIDLEEWKKYCKNKLTFGNMKLQPIDDKTGLALLREEIGVTHEFNVNEETKICYIV